MPLSQVPWKIVVLVVVSLAILYSLPLSNTYKSLSSQAASTAANVLNTNTNSNRPLVLYSYADSDTSRENLQFFVDKGVHGQADFVFIFNGESNATEIVPTTFPNVRLVQRNNTCYDLGAYGEVLQKDDLWKRYRRFILMNASVRGPFFPNYLKPCWSEALLGRLTDKVKLVGTTINCEPQPHLQSMLLATDNVGMEILLDPIRAVTLGQVNKWGAKDAPVGLSHCYADRKEAVHAEIGITGLIRKEGYAVDVMLTSFSVDDEDDNLTSYCAVRGNHYQDPLVENAYFGTNIHPYEMMFIKTNRGMAKKTIEVMTSFHKKRQWSSWDVC